MFYSFEFTALPAITRFYSVTRDTIWQIADKDHILIFIKEGECKIIYEQEEYILKEGDIFYIPANRTYRREPTVGMCTMEYIHFTLSSSIHEENTQDLKEKLFETKNRLNTEMLNSDYTPMHYPDTVYLQNKNTPKSRDRISSLLDGINLFSNTRQLTCHLQSAVNLADIIITLSALSIEEILTNINIKGYFAVSPNLKKALKYIALHYSEPISLDDLCACCNVSKQQLIRYFKEYLKTTPTKYINEYKMFHAKEMLIEYPQLSVNEISLELGFDNQHYFSRVFKKTTGSSPLQYRKLNHN